MSEMDTTSKDSTNEQMKLINDSLVGDVIHESEENTNDETKQVDDANDAEIIDENEEDIAQNEAEFLLLSPDEDTQDKSELIIETNQKREHDEYDTDEDTQPLITEYEPAQYY